MFPVYASDGVYILGDSSKIKGKQAAIKAQADLDGVTAVPEDYKGPICPKCGSHKIRQLSAAREAAECLEPTHRAKVGIKMLPALYVCPCGKRWEEVG